MSTGETRPPDDERLQEAIVVRHEEEATVEAGWRGVGFLRARKHVATAAVKELVPVDLDELELERTPVAEGDSGQVETLPDGTISIPLYAEELVITRRTVLKERMLIRKRVVSEQRRVETEIRKEVVELDADEGVELVVDDAGATPPRPPAPS